MHTDQISVAQQHMYNSTNVVGLSGNSMAHGMSGNNNYASNFGEHAPSDYLKSLNQSATNANTRALKTKSSARSMERQNKAAGAMTPSIERHGANQKGVKGS